MRVTRISSAWLSDDMARALAAMSPPLQSSHVARAADALTMRTGSTRVVGFLLDWGADLRSARTVVEAAGGTAWRPRPRHRGTADQAEIEVRPHSLGEPRIGAGAGRK
jgi:hypothetical protein